MGACGSSYDVKLFIKCVYDIKDNNDLIQIINDREGENINKEIENKIKIVIGNKKEKLVFKKKFKNIGKYAIRFIVESRSIDFSYIFNKCINLKK